MKKKDAIRERSQQGFELQKLTEYKIRKGNIVLSDTTPYLLNVQTYVREELKNHPRLAITQLYKVRFQDDKAPQACLEADPRPVHADILAVEFNCRYVFILAFLEDAIMPVALDIRDGELVITAIYKSYEWINQITAGELQSLCDAVAERFEATRNEVSLLSPFCINRKNHKKCNYGNDRIYPCL